MRISITCVVLSTFAQHNYFTSTLQVKYTPSGILQKADHKTGYRKPQKNCPKNVNWWSSVSDKFIQSSKATVQVHFWSTKERSVPTRHSQKTKNKGTLCQHVMSYSSFSYINNWEQESVQVLTCYIRRTLPVSQPGQVPFCYVWFGKIVVAAFKEILSKSTY